MNHQSSSTVKHWYLLSVMGLVFIGAGIWAFVTPEMFYTTLAIMFALMFLLTGLIEIVYTLINRNEIDNWGWSLAGGIFDLVLGIWLFSKPQISVFVLTLVLSLGILFRSILSIAWALTLKKYQILDWGNLLAVGILGLIVGIIMLWNPRFAGMTIAFYTGFAFVFIGCLQIYLSFKLRKLKKRIM